MKWGVEYRKDRSYEHMGPVRSTFRVFYWDANPFENRTLGEGGKRCV